MDRLRKGYRPLIALLLVVLLGCACARANGTIRFGTSKQGGIYYAFGETFARILTKENKDFDVKVKVTNGSAANVNLLAEQYIQMAIAQSNVISDADNLEGDFEMDENLHDYSAVAGLYSEACQVVVMADSPIKNIQGLRGKTVCVGEEKSGTEQSSKEILSAYGLYEKITKTYMDYPSEIEALKSGKIDAFVVVAGIATPAIEKLAKQKKIRFVPIVGDVREAICTENEHYYPFTIPANTYTNQNEDVETVAIKSVLLVSNTLNESTVKTITETLFAHKKELFNVMPTESLTEEEATLGVPIPFHPGAQAYYESKGITVNR